jgi:chaperonin GroEL (HSP60 family)
MLKGMVDKILAKGANVVICQKGIDDLAQHFLARKNILAVRRVKKSDMEKLAKATGGKIITNLDDMTKRDLGFAELVEERKIADDKMTFIEGCKNPRAVTILIRGGTERIVDEAERSLHDALCVARDVIEEPKVVAGGGAPELEIAKALREYADSLPGREQLAITRFA